ncbi:hypothetical protein ES702_06090 [subsurface metagenome]
MPPNKDIHRHDNRQKLKTPEIHLMRRQVLHQTLRRLRQPEDSPQIHSQRSDSSSRDKSLEFLGGDAPGAVHEKTENDDEDEEGDDLEGETGEENVVGGCGVVAGGVGYAYHCGAGDLDDCGEDVAEDEDPEDGFGGHGRVLSAYAVYGDCDKGIDCGLELFVSCFGIGWG